MPPKVLFVDDEPDLESLILLKFRRQIRQGEVNFVFAQNGEEALAKLRTDNSIGIVFSDINMPVMDGLTLLSRLPELERSVKTVIVSAYDDMSNIRTAMNRGAFDFLTKPIDFQDFETTLAKTATEVGAIRESEERGRQLQELRTELNIASQIQQDILPKNFPNESRFELYASMLPARMVGGDFYDFLAIDDHRVAFTIGDVSGKGVPAAIFMAMCRTLLRATDARCKPPVECLREINRTLLQMGGNGMFVTLCHGIFDARSGEIDFCVGGHTPPYVLKRGSPPQRLIETGGNMIGILEEPEIGVNRIFLEPGDLFFLYTDGVPDAEDQEGNPFSQLRLTAILDGFAGTARETVDYVFSEVKKFSAGAPQADDITAMAIRFLPQP